MARILIADDQPIVRKALAELIRKSGESWEVCAQADNGAAAVEQAIRWTPDLVILDLRMPQRNGISAGHAIRERLPGTPVLIWTWLDVFAMEGPVREAGLQGIVQKSDGAAILLAIRDALASKTVFPGHRPGAQAASPTFTAIPSATVAEALPADLAEEPGQAERPAERGARRKSSTPTSRKGGGSA